jgi:reductive dehalogenase
MGSFLLIFLITGVIIGIFLGLFSVLSVIERKRRAALLGALLFVAFFGVWFGVLIFLYPNGYIMIVAVILVAVLGLLFFLPIGKAKVQQIDRLTDKVDERDVIFARAEYRNGTREHDSYYAMKPEKKEIDDKIRRQPALFSSGGRYYDPVRSEYVASQFELEERLVTLVDGPVCPEKRHVDPEEMSGMLKKITLHLGADEVGIARLNPYYVYSHVGKGPEPWGAEIENNHPFVISYTVEMDYTQVEEAPGIGITEETALQYLNLQRISIVLAEYIRKLGYGARAHISGSNYQIMLPPVAYDAGLGELGRLGYLISPRFGARIRLGAVTTEMPLVPGKPFHFGVQDFCEKCKKCAVNCPPGAITYGSKTKARGIEKWQLDVERCYHFWRVIGTDCGLCMKVCPFSHPDRLVHNVLRQGIKRSSFARSLCVFGDDLFYGKRIYPREVKT